MQHLSHHTVNIRQIIADRINKLKEKVLFPTPKHKS